MDFLRPFAEVFGKVRQKVIWQMKGEPPFPLPKNVKTMPWLPQNDLLGVFIARQRSTLLFSQLWFIDCFVIIIRVNQGYFAQQLLFVSSVKETQRYQDVFRDSDNYSRSSWTEVPHSCIVLIFLYCLNVLCIHVHVFTCLYN